MCPPPERATLPLIPPPCTDERRNGPCRVSAPKRTAPEDGKGRGCEFEVHYMAKFLNNPPPQEPGTRYYVLGVDDSVPELGGSRPDRLLDVQRQQQQSVLARVYSFVVKRISKTSNSRLAHG